MLLTSLCTGTSKVAEPYKIGTRTTDVKLEILNLDKKEVIPIDEISNQEFTQVSKLIAYSPPPKGALISLTCTY